MRARRALVAPVLFLYVGMIDDASSSLQTCDMNEYKYLPLEEIANSARYLPHLNFAEADRSKQRRACLP